MHEKDKEDVIRFGQNVHTTQTFSKKETLKRPTQSSEGSITKLPTQKLSGEFTSPLKRLVRREVKMLEVAPQIHIKDHTSYRLQPVATQLAKAT